MTISLAITIFPAMDDSTKGSMRPKDKHRRKTTRKPRQLQARAASVKAFIKKFKQVKP